MRSSLCLLWIFWEGVSGARGEGGPCSTNKRYFNLPHMKLKSQVSLSQNKNNKIPSKESLDNQLNTLELVIYFIFGTIYKVIIKS